MVEGSHIVENKLQLLEVMKFIININNLIKNIGLWPPSLLCCFNKQMDVGTLIE
jgi:hypothetical protein